jgi:hypothetical protein
MWVIDGSTRSQSFPANLPVVSKVQESTFSRGLTGGAGDGVELVATRISIRDRSAVDVRQRGEQGEFYFSFDKALGAYFVSPSDKEIWNSLTAISFLPIDR